MTELLETAPGAVVDKEAVGGVDMGGEFGVDCTIGLKQGVCSSEECCKGPWIGAWETPKVYITIADDVGFFVDLMANIRSEGENGEAIGAFQA